MPALLFDFDGVLADSEPMHEKALRALAASRGWSFSPEQYLTRYVGLDDRDCFQRLAADHNQHLDQATAHALHAEKWRHCQGLIEAGEAPAFPGSLELAQEARRAGWTISICSGARRREIEAILTHWGATGLFSTITSADCVERAKPDPAIYMLAARRAGEAPAGCVAIEDTDRGIASAKGAGCRVIGVCHTLPAERLAAAGRIFPRTADLSFDHVRAMLA